MSHCEGISQEEIDVILDVTIPTGEGLRRWEEGLCRRAGGESEKRKNLRACERFSVNELPTRSHRAFYGII